MKDYQTVIAVMVLVCSFLASGASAPGPYSGGDGTAANPYQIANVADFLDLSATSIDWNKHFILTANLDLADHPFTNSPIAPDESPDSGFQGTRFSGVFDGGGNTISNLTLAASDKEFVGLFGYVDSGGQIKNLGVENVDIQGRNQVGGLVGYCDQGSISSCYATGVVRGIRFVGGLAGEFSHSELVFCYAAVTVDGERFVGGLLGWNFGLTSYCFATGTVRGTSYVGGLTGCNYYGTVSSCYATGVVSGIDCVGGLAGDNFIGEITSCYATGSVSGRSSVGGLVGPNSGLIADCYSSGAVSGELAAGGFVGYNDDDHYEGRVIAGFWDTQTSGLSHGVGYGSSIGLIGKTTAEMNNIQTFLHAGWFFLDVDKTFGEWTMAEEGYPKLAWQVYTPAVVPYLKETTEQEAIVTLHANGLLYGESSFVYDASVSVGLVSKTYPASGSIVYTGLTPVHILLANNTKYAGGDGITEPYEIVDLGNWVDMMNSPGDWDKSFILMSDINLDGQIFTQAPIAPNIGYSSNFQGTPFSGIFDGNGHTISNLTVRPVIQKESLLGLFGLASGQIENLRIIDANIRGGFYIGVLAGVNTGTIANCDVSGLVSGISWVGGLTGENFQGWISGCRSNSDVAGSLRVGGTVGYNFGNIHNSYSSGQVAGDSMIGGMVGVNSGLIANSYSIAKVSGDSWCGAFAGINETEMFYEGTITNSFWNLHVSGSDTGVGGGTADGVVGKTTIEMQTLATFLDVGWDFVDVWALCEGTNYPRLRWAIPATDWVCPDGVGGADFAHLAAWWLADDCAQHNDCDGADLNQSGDVGLYELVLLTEQWLR